MNLVEHVSQQDDGTTSSEELSSNLNKVPGANRTTSTEKSSSQSGRVGVIASSTTRWGNNEESPREFWTSRLTELSIKPSRAEVRRVVLSGR